MKRGWLWVALLLSLGVNIGVLATIGVTRARLKSRWERPPGEGRPPVARLADHLRLEGEAREQFLAIQQDLFDTTHRHRQALESLRAELRQELMAEDPDAEKVERLLAQSGEVYQALDRALIDSILASRQILTPEQQQRYFHVLGRMRHAAMRFGPPGRRPGRPPRRP